MPDKILSSPLFQWIIAIVFGVGSGIGTGRFMYKNHETRLVAAETEIKDKLLTEKTHGIMCEKERAEIKNLIHECMRASFLELKDEIIREVKRA